MEEKDDSQQMKGKTSDLSSQIDEVKEIMKKNVNQILHREENLDKLLEVHIHIHHLQTRKGKIHNSVSRSYWWKNVKLMVAVVVIVLIIVVVIILLAVGVIPISPPVAPVVTPTIKP
uniref:V-SNARE coiled-coil homology domain-containing protein n=1 Tax=Poecilia reticulata TaxID=8081 RepID=A0A3P9PM32_POERE